jgi:hypothetical protein
VERVSEFGKTCDDFPEIPRNAQIDEVVGIDDDENFGYVILSGRAPATEVVEEVW